MNELIQPYLESVAYEAKLNKAGVTPEISVIDTTDKAAQILWLPPVMTYEWIILLNPIGSKNAIIYSEDLDDRSAEEFFYQTHKDIEKEMYPIIQWLLESFSQNTSTTQISELLDTSIESMEKVLIKMITLYRKLDKEAFSRFRGYFMPIAFRKSDGENYPWPSGASSAIFPTFDTLIGIEQVAPLSLLAEKVFPILSDRGYTTLSDLVRARSVVIQYWSLLSRYSDDTVVLGKIRVLIDTLKKFRINHRSNVEKFLPEVMAKKWWGSWWAADVPEYLNAIIDNTKKARG